MVADDRGVLLLTDEWRDRHRRAEVWEQRTGLAVTRSPPLAAAPSERLRLLLVEPSGAERRLTPRLDVGRDDQLRVAGCYRPEASGERAVRWTGHRAWILMPSGEDVRFVWSAAGHPEAPVRVDVLANGRPVGTARVPAGWQTSAWFELPSGAAQQVIELRIPPYSPADLGTAPADHRRLGIRLDVVEVRGRVPG